MKDDIYDIVIIGGGASGLMLAANLDLGGSKGLLLEGSSRLGTKLLMSGGGHCNITHGGPMKDFISAYGDAGPKLRRCLYRHSNLELASWLDSHGVRLAGENGEAIDPALGMMALEGAGRVFPASMKSQDVLAALVDEAGKNGWQTETGEKVTGLEVTGSRLLSEPEKGSACPPGSAEEADTCSSAEWEITTIRGKKIRARNIVAAAGGVTCPETGSDGSVLGMLAELGLAVTETRPALAPVYVNDYPYSELAGISLGAVTVMIFDESGRRCARMKGDVLFTHEGFSGPVILNISRYARPGRTLRLCYNMDLAELPKRMQRVLRERSRGYLGDVRTGVLTSLLDHDDFVIDRVDERGMVTAGGVSLDQLDPATMRVKSFGAGNAGGIYIIGETLDADGITGGYNLQLCWSTACAAADDLRSKLQLQ